MGEDRNFVYLSETELELEERFFNYENVAICGVTPDSLENGGPDLKDGTAYYCVKDVYFLALSGSPEEAAEPVHPDEKRSNIEIFVEKGRGRGPEVAASEKVFKFL